MTVPISRLGEYFRFVKKVAEERKLRIPVMGHAGDGNVHPIILYDNTREEERLQHPMPSKRFAGGHSKWEGME